jgi:hypothetical protein
VTGDDLVEVIAKNPSIIKLIDPGGRTVCGRGSDRALLRGLQVHHRTSAAARPQD